MSHSDEINLAILDVKSALLTAFKDQSSLYLRNSMSITQMQLIFDLKYKNQYQQIIHELIMNYAVKSEKIGPGSFFSCIKKTLKLLESKTFPVNTSLTDILKFGSINPDKKDVQWCINSYMNSNNTDKKILENALDLAGFAGRVIIEKSDSVDSIEVMKGYSFEGLKPQWDVNMHIKNCRVLCIDGYIESASEIHNFLSSASETNETIILFVRGLSQDVLNTIRVNYDRGTIKVLPIVVPFDVLGINTINDISIVSGCDLISSLKGDQITTLSVTDTSIIDESIITPAKLTIINSKTNNSVVVHTKALLEKRSKEKIDDVIELLDKRIRSLSPNHVIVRLVNDHNWTSRVQAFDYTLRALRSLSDYGTLMIDNKKELTSSYISSEINSTKCIESINQLGYIIT